MADEQTGPRAATVTSAAPELPRREFVRHAVAGVAGLALTAVPGTSYATSATAASYSRSSGFMESPPLILCLRQCTSFALSRLS